MDGTATWQLEIDGDLPPTHDEIVYHRNLRSDMARRIQLAWRRRSWTVVQSLCEMHHNQSIVRAVAASLIVLWARAHRRARGLSVQADAALPADCRNANDFHQPSLNIATKCCAWMTFGSCLPNAALADQHLGPYLPRLRSQNIQDELRQEWLNAGASDRLVFAIQPIPYLNPGTHHSQAMRRQIYPGRDVFTREATMLHFGQHSAAMEFTGLAIRIVALNEAAVAYLVWYTMKGYLGRSLNPTVEMLPGAGGETHLRANAVQREHDNVESGHYHDWDFPCPSGEPSPQIRPRSDLDLRRSSPKSRVKTISGLPLRLWPSRCRFGIGFLMTRHAHCMILTPLMRDGLLLLHPTLSTAQKLAVQQLLDRHVHIFSSLDVRGAESGTSWTGSHMLTLTQFQHSQLTNWRSGRSSVRRVRESALPGRIGRYTFWNATPIWLVWQAASTITRFVRRRNLALMSLLILRLALSERTVRREMYVDVTMARRVEMLLSLKCAFKISLLKPVNECRRPPRLPGEVTPQLLRVGLMQSRSQSGEPRAYAITPGLGVLVEALNEQAATFVRTWDQLWNGPRSWLARYDYVYVHPFQVELPDCRVRYHDGIPYHRVRYYDRDIVLPLTPSHAVPFEESSDARHNFEVWSATRLQSLVRGHLGRLEARDRRPLDYSNCFDGVPGCFCRFEEEAQEEGSEESSSSSPLREDEPLEESSNPLELECKCPYWCPAHDQPLACNDVRYTPSGDRYAVGPFTGRKPRDSGRIDVCGYMIALDGASELIAVGYARQLIMALHHCARPGPVRYVSELVVPAVVEFASWHLGETSIHTEVASLLSYSMTRPPAVISSDEPTVPEADADQSVPLAAQSEANGSELEIQTRHAILLSANERSDRDASLASPVQSNPAWSASHREQAAQALTDDERGLIQMHADDPEAQEAWAFRDDEDCSTCTQDAEEAMEIELIEYEGQMPSAASAGNLMTASRLDRFEKENAESGITFKAFYEREHESTRSSAVQSP